MCSLPSKKNIFKIGEQRLDTSVQKKGQPYHKHKGRISEANLIESLILYLDSDVENDSDNGIGGTSGNINLNSPGFAFIITTYSHAFFSISNRNM
jgi:hypothetical protein